MISGWLVILSLAVLLGLVFSLYTLIMQYIARQAMSQFDARYRAADEIINDGHVPELWIGDYRRQIEAIEAKGGSAAEIERIGSRAKKEVLKRIRSLRQLFRGGRYYDSPDTKYEVLETLREREEQWAANTWQELLASRAEKPDVNQPPGVPGDADQGGKNAA